MAGNGAGIKVTMRPALTAISRQNKRARKPSSWDPWPGMGALTRPL